MEQLWSVSTTIREAERIIPFLRIASEMEGLPWNDENQCKFQIMLIKYRYYLNDTDNAQTFRRLNQTQINILRDLNHDMSYEEAKDIFDSKNYVDPPMRGRTSFQPLRKLGLADVNTSGCITITETGKKLLNNEITLSDALLRTFLKFQYPNPLDSGFRNWNTKPFVNLLRLIKKVNQLCQERNLTPKGISTIEFGIYFLSLRTYEDIEEVAREILDFRAEYKQLSSDEEKKNFVRLVQSEYLAEFNNPFKNCKEYTDNVIRYLRVTKYIYIRGAYGNKYIDLEPRRMHEINCILDNDNGKAKCFDNEEWSTYMGRYDSYQLPFENIRTLQLILRDINCEIAILEKKLGINTTNCNIPEDRTSLNKLIESRRAYRLVLQSMEITFDYQHDIARVDDIVSGFNDLIRHRNSSPRRPSVELENLSNIALNILDDALRIKPNAQMGDDNVPVFTAPAGVADIECYYDNFNSICEVTMLQSRDQWVNEGQPVMRHLRDFEDINNDKQCYCLFVAPSLHRDTVNTFYTSVVYEFEGKKQKIIPITISQFIRILEIGQKLLYCGQKIHHEDLMNFYDKCIDRDSFGASTNWLQHIELVLKKWEENVQRLEETNNLINSNVTAEQQAIFGNN